ncbi:TPA: hypothetical protein ACH3X2_006106 [Trebouxia sp. C0005]
MSKRKKSVKKPPRLHRNQATASKPSSTKRKQQDTAARRKVASGDRGPKSKTGPQYHESQQILCVGEGNFSFARALVRTLEGQGQNLTATAYDARDTVDAKYQGGGDPVSDIIQELQVCDVTLCYGVDATQLAKSLQVASKKQHVKNLPQAFDRIIFNFPHVGLGIKDQDINVQKNQQMLSSFFFSACEVLKADGEIHVTLKDGKPYSLWNIVSLAHHATQGVLILKTTCPFHADQYPGKIIAQHDCKHGIVMVVLKETRLKTAVSVCMSQADPCCPN